MKKLAMLLLSLLLTISLVSCSSDNSNAPTNPVNNDNTEKPIPENKEPEKPEIVFEEIVVVDNEFCTIKITGINPDNMWGYTVNTFLENKSTDKTYMFSLDGASVNGIHTEPLFATEVAASKKSNAEISFMDPIFKDFDVKDFTDIELSFRVYNSDDWSADDLAKENINVYPLGQDKALKFERPSQQSDTVLVDNDLVSIVVTGYENDDIWGYSANLYLVNKTDKEVMVSVDDVSVNGYMADPFWATTVKPGKVRFSSMSWSDTVFEENSISEVESIEMKLRVYDAKNWNAKDIHSGTITLNP